MKVSLGSPSFVKLAWLDSRHPEQALLEQP